MAKMVLHVALAALGLLMVPLIASRLIDGWHWPPRAFVLAYVLFFITGMAYALIAKRASALAYKAGVGLALAAGFALGWSNMVHVADSENPANLVYFGVLVVGAAGAALARLRPGGLAWTLFTMAATLAVLALAVPSGAPPELARNMAIGHTILVALFISSGLLFRHVARGHTR